MDDMFGNPLPEEFRERLLKLSDAAQADGEPYVGSRNYTRQRTVIREKFHGHVWNPIRRWSNGLPVNPMYRARP